MSYTVPAPALDHFLCDTDEVLARIDAIDPHAYDRSRNDLDGATTWLGPFLTHGITDTREVAGRVLEPPGGEPRSPGDCYRLLFELGWREFFHRTWQLEGEEVFGDMHRGQSGVASEKPPRAVLGADTGVDVVDAAIAHLLEHGTMHNHARMWTAAITCNIGRSGWWQGARWLHHHLLDGDLASNTLSWQWVAGTFSNKRYLANQENVDKFSKTRQSGSWLDVSYDELASLSPPERFAERAEPDAAGDAAREAARTPRGRHRAALDLAPRSALGARHGTRARLRRHGPARRVAAVGEALAVHRALGRDAAARTSSTAARARWRRRRATRRSCAASTPPAATGPARSRSAAGSTRCRTRRSPASRSTGSRCAAAWACNHGP